MGVALSDSNISLFGNYIGVDLNGSTPDGNAGDGVLVNTTSNNNVIGATSTLVPSETTNAISIASNVISGNRGNGIELDGSTGNSIVANYVGVDVSGTIAVGNLGNGIELEGAVNNTIGGTISFNNTTGLVPDSNIVSGNGGDGILLQNSSTGNTVASNFVGVNVTGISPLGNTLDGLAIASGSNDNQIIGTYFNLNPFVFANVISGNHGNGISVTSANDNVIHANYLGVGVDNQTAVGNAPTACWSLEPRPTPSSEESFLWATSPRPTGKMGLRFETPHREQSLSTPLLASLRSRPTQTSATARMGSSSRRQAWATSSAPTSSRPTTATALSSAVMPPESRSITISSA